MNEINHNSFSPDMSRFRSRLLLQGDMTFSTAHRIGAERSLEVDLPDLPVLRTIHGLPYIPGSSFKGAWRSYTEAILRTVQSQPDVRDKNLACLSVSKPQVYGTYNPRPAEGYCLTQTDVNNRKKDERYRDARALLDQELRQDSCWVCRVFGSSWLASKLLVKDLFIDEASFWRTEIRDGVGIDRDTGRAGDGLKYQFETVPASARFRLEVVVENASPAELGLIVIGLQAFRRGDILLGGAKSRGLGWCQWQPDWEACHYVEEKNLLDHLLRLNSHRISTENWEGDKGLFTQWFNNFKDQIRPTDLATEQ